MCYDEIWVFSCNHKSYKTRNSCPKAPSKNYEGSDFCRGSNPADNILFPRAELCYDCKVRRTFLKSSSSQASQDVPSQGQQQLEYTDTPNQQQLGGLGGLSTNNPAQYGYSNFADPVQQQSQYQQPQSTSNPAQGARGSMGPPPIPSRNPNQQPQSTRNPAQGARGSMGPPPIPSRNPNQKVPK
ncbi:hypothetical protein QBC46DRAFT_141394 [Diplogelasinospora grovesii]|uniref:Uncharacterized protein n=1 Tax=Diplogelasinospora grovesii TaxID=303347 RepID=A0AAN6N7Q9_9PEZI|nr:hypothetical protein QBC46DRAFT_141394 [Diplogelasinospora grovesii]